MPNATPPPIAQGGACHRGAPRRRRQHQERDAPRADGGEERVGRGHRPDRRRGQHQERRGLPGPAAPGHLPHGEQHGGRGGGPGEDQEHRRAARTAEADPVEADEEERGAERVALDVDRVRRRTSGSVKVSTNGRRRARRPASTTAGYSCRVSSPRSRPDGPRTSARAAPQTTATSAEPRSRRRHGSRANQPGSRAARPQAEHQDDGHRRQERQVHRAGERRGLDLPLGPPG